MDGVSQILELLFSSIDDDAAAAELGAAVAALCGAAVFTVQLRSAAGARYLISHNTSPTMAARYVDYFWRRDIWSDRFPKDVLGQVVTSESFVSDAEFLNSEIYTDHFRQEGDLARLAGSVTPLDDDRRLLIGVTRTRRQTNFTAEEVARFQGLLPLLAHGAQARLRRESQGGLLANRLLDAEPDPAMVVDGQGGLKFASRAARAALAVGAPLVRTGEGVAAAGPDGARFARAVEWACSGRGGSVVRLSDATGGVQSIAVDPLPGEPGLAAVRWRDAAARQREDLAAAREALGLTAAETAVAEALMRGQSPLQYAQARGVRITTVRSQLRSLFGKAGVTRQAELVVALKTGGGRRKDAG